MKIAIITSGRLPVPATKGGAVERSWDFDKDTFSEKYLQALNIVNT